jgi:putative hydrolase of HD superfamily
VSIDDERLGQIFEFLGLVDGLKGVYRAAYLSDQSRHESDAEHVWHTCLFALLLHRESNIEVDIAHALELLVIHDLVEVFAGDSALHDEAARETKEEREREAAERLYALLPDDLQEEWMGWWREFEDAATPEARFAVECDRLQAIHQNIIAEGRTWADYRVTEEYARERNRRAMGFDPVLSEVFEALYSRATEEWLWYGGGEEGGERAGPGTPGLGPTPSDER